MEAWIRVKELGYKRNKLSEVGRRQKQRAHRADPALPSRRRNCWVQSGHQAPLFPSSEFGVCNGYFIFKAKCVTWKQFFDVMTQLRWLASGNYYSPNKCQRAKREMENLPGAKWSLDSSEPGGKATAVRLQTLAIVKVGKHDFFLFGQLDEWWKYKMILKDGISYWVFRTTVVLCFHS